MESLRIIDSWPVPNAAVGVFRKDGAVAAHGPGDRPFPLASVTKLLSAYAALVAIEEGAVEPDDPAGPEGSTVHHLLAHTSGLAFDEYRQMAAPGTRRIYSNTGIEVLAATIAEATGIAFADYVRQAVLEPLGMTATVFSGSPAHGARSTVTDLGRFAAEVLAPTLLAPLTVAEATSVAFRGLDGVLPGYGVQRPNDWGLGFEIRGTKSPHWTGTTHPPSTFGHFGGAGTFLWVDPTLHTACVCLTDRDFDTWAVQAWTPFNDAVRAELL